MKFQLFTVRGDSQKWINNANQGQRSKLMSKHSLPKFLSSSRLLFQNDYRWNVYDVDIFGLKKIVKHSSLGLRILLSYRSGKNNFYRLLIWAKKIIIKPNVYT